MNFDINPITANVENTYELYKEYYIFSVFKIGARKYLRWFFLIIYPLLIIITTAEAIILEFDSFLFFCDILLILLFIYMIISIRLGAKKYYKTIQKIFAGIVSYTFKNDEFSVYLSNNACTGETIMRYDSIYRIYETETMFYVFISSKQAYLISKSCIIGGSATDLRTLFQSKIESKKFISRCK